MWLWESRDQECGHHVQPVVNLAPRALIVPVSLLNCRSGFAQVPPLRSCDHGHEHDGRRGGQAGQRHGLETRSQDGNQHRIQRGQGAGESECIWTGFHGETHVRHRLQEAVHAALACHYHILRRVLELWHVRGLSGPHIAGHRVSDILQRADYELGVLRSAPLLPGWSYHLRISSTEVSRALIFTRVEVLNASENSINNNNNNNNKKWCFFSCLTFQLVIIADVVIEVRFVWYFYQWCNSVLPMVIRISNIFHMIPI